MFQNCIKIKPQKKHNEKLWFTSAAKQNNGDSFLIKSSNITDTADIIFYLQAFHLLTSPQQVFSVKCSKHITGSIDF